MIVGAIGFLIFSRSSKTDTPKDPEVAANTNSVPVVTPTDLPSITPEPTTEPEAPKAVRLTDTTVISPILFYQGTGITYLEKTGQLFQTDLQTSDNTVLLSNKREISIALKNNINKILWPLVGNSFIAESDGLGKKVWSYYDPSKAAYVDIPSQVYSLDWMPTGDKIMFTWVDENHKAFLNIGNPDTSGYTVLTDLYEPDNLISVAPDGKNLLFYRNQSSDLTKNTINMVSVDGKTFRTVIQDGFNKGVKWSPDSSKFLFTKRDASGKFQLWVDNLSTGEIRNLGLSTTVDKVIWTKDSKMIYAAIPTKGTAGEGLTEDSIYQINVDTASKVEFPPGLASDAEEMFLSDSEDILFYKNYQDQSLYYMKVGGPVTIQ